MAENADTQRAEPKSIGGELIIPVVALFFTLYYFYTIIDAPWTAQVAAFIVGTILIVLVVLILIKSVRSLSSGEGRLDFSNLINPKAYVPKRLGLLALTITYIFIVPSLGFTITTFLFLSIAMLILNDWRKKRFIILLSAVLSLGGYLLFIVAFKTRFPAGPFEIFMKTFL